MESKKIRQIAGQKLNFRVADKNEAPSDYTEA
jgi:hypothetical protein